MANKEKYDGITYSGTFTMDEGRENHVSKAVSEILRRLDEEEKKTKAASKKKKK